MKDEEIEIVLSAIKKFGDGFWTDQSEVEGTTSNDSLFNEIVSFVNQAGYDLRLEKLEREFEYTAVTKIDDLSPCWKEIVNKCHYKFTRGVFADFGLAEECIAFLEFEILENTPFFEVGIGEALRPYIAIYKGVEGPVASRTFTNVINARKLL